MAGTLISAAPLSVSAYHSSMSAHSSSESRP